MLLTRAAAGTRGDRRRAYGPLDARRVQRMLGSRRARAWGYLKVPCADIVDRKYTLVTPLRSGSKSAMHIIGPATCVVGEAILKPNVSLCSKPRRRWSKRW